MEYDWESQQPYAYWLECVKGLGRKSRWELVEAAGSPRAAYEMTGKEWRMILSEKKAEALERAREAGGAESAEERYRQFCKGEIRYIPHMHPDYPERLKKIPDPPFGIFLWGKLPEEREPAVAIIGARECSEYGRYVAEKAAMELAEKGIGIISGMARGIDGISQWAALRAGGNTYAVLGCGVDICYPPGNRGLYEELKKRGGVLSEYLPGTSPQAGLFPMRNRIISGLSDLVLIVEAREKSGTLITADMALEQGKEVYAVPGRVTDSLSSGCNRLIKQGAGMAASIEEMLEESGILKVPAETEKRERVGNRESPKRRQESKGKEEQAGIFRYLDFYPKCVEQLQKESGMEYRQMICELMELCMENKAEQVSAGQYLKKRDTQG